MSIGEEGERSQIKGVVKELVDKLINDYLSVNPKEGKHLKK
jgi:hypothetical protein